MTSEYLTSQLLDLNFEQPEYAQVKELINCSESVSYTDDEIESAIFLMIKKMKNAGILRKFEPGIWDTTSDTVHGKVLAVVRSHDSEAGANKHTDFGHLGSELFLGAN